MERTSLDELIEGLTLIRSVDPKSYFSAEHDEVFCGEVEKFSEDQRKQMAELNWSVSDFGAWHHWV